MPGGDGLPLVQRQQVLHGRMGLRTVRNLRSAVPARRHLHPTGHAVHQARLPRSWRHLRLLGHGLRRRRLRDDDVAVREPDVFTKCAYRGPNRGTHRRAALLLLDGEELRREQPRHHQLRVHKGLQQKLRILRRLLRVQPSVPAQGRVVPEDRPVRVDGPRRVLRDIVHRYPPRLHVLPRGGVPPELQGLRVPAGHARRGRALPPAVHPTVPERRHVHDRRERRHGAARVRLRRDVDRRPVRTERGAHGIAIGEPVAADTRAVGVAQRVAVPGAERVAVNEPVGRHARADGQPHDADGRADRPRHGVLMDDAPAVVQAIPVSLLLSGLQMQLQWSVDQPMLLDDQLRDCP